MALAGGAVFMAVSLASAQPMISTELNGSRINFDQPPVMQDGRVLVPLRGIFENLGADVVYTPANKTIKATADGQTVELTLGQRQAFVNGRQMYLDVPADTINGRTMVPLRFVSEAMGADVKWRSASRTVAITRDPIDPSTVGDNNNNTNNNGNETAVKPEISQLIHNARGTLNPGDTLTVTLVGDAGSQASFSILGAVQEVPMTEVSSGRYEGRMNIPNGLGVNNGTLIGYLRKDGKEDVQEASRSVTIASNTNSNVPANGEISVFPTPGTIVGQTRPTLQTVFPEYVRNGSATLRLDGQTYSPTVSSDGRTVAFTPSYGLNPGVHTVETQALTQDGRMMTKQWNFTVSSSATDNNGNQTNPSVSVSNLQDGSTVPQVFNIQGRTTPYTKVVVDAAAQRALIPGVIGIRGREFRTQTVSDAQGNFNVQLDTQDLPSRSRIDIEVSVMNSNGNVSDTVDLNLVRQ